jgi:hypothetical protein
MSSNDEVDGWIAQLMQCKPLSETEVKKLCDKVGRTPTPTTRRTARAHYSKWSRDAAPNPPCPSPSSLGREEKGDAGACACARARSGGMTPTRR